MLNKPALKNFFVSSLLAVVVFSSLPLITEARTVIRSGNTVSVGQDQLIEGDFYTVGLIINISGQVEEDLLAAGTEVNVNGQVGADAFIVASDVEVNSTIGDDLRIIGETVVISGPVLGDVFVVGGNVKILSSASVTGDVTLIGGSAEVSGSVDGRILGWLDSLRVDSAVAGDIDVTVTQLTLGENAAISGDVKYVSLSQLTRSQSATIVGEEFRIDPVIEDTSLSLSTLLVPLLMLLFSVALWHLLARRFLQRVVDRALTPGIRVVILGTLILLFGPLAMGILLVSMLGLLAGLVALSGFILFLTLSIVALPAVMGQFVYSLFSEPSPTVSLLILVVGALLVGVCLVVPIVGPVLLIGFTILNFGALVDVLLRANR